MAVSCTRRLEFDAAHRVVGHEGKCANLHGHRYIIEIEASAISLDQVGRIIDFSVLKSKIGSWIDEYWDHTTILLRGDPMIEALVPLQKNKEIYISDWNPTAENMAECLLKEICPKLLDGSGVSVTSIRVYETPNCWADAK